MNWLLSQQRTNQPDTENYETMRGGLIVVGLESETEKRKSNDTTIKYNNYNVHNKG